MKLAHTKYINEMPVTIVVTCRNREDARNGDVNLHAILFEGKDISDIIMAFVDDAIKNGLRLSEQITYPIDWEQVWAETMADILEYQNADV